MRLSAFALTEAKYAAGDIRHTVFDNVESVRSSLGVLRSTIGLQVICLTPMEASWMAGYFGVNNVILSAAADL